MPRPPVEECRTARPIRINTNEILYIRSRAGLETCCYFDGLDIAFDIGCLFGRVKTKRNVFISHGHIDHIGAIAQHAARRQLHNLPVANYYVPESLVCRVESLLQSYFQLQEVRARLYTLLSIHRSKSYRTPFHMLLFPLPRAKCTH